jgi:hypothetical protein
MSAMVYDRPEVIGLSPRAMKLCGGRRSTILVAYNQGIQPRTASFMPDPYEALIFQTYTEAEIQEIQALNDRMGCGNLHFNRPQHL